MGKKLPVIILLDALCGGGGGKAGEVFPGFVTGAGGGGGRGPPPPPPPPQYSLIFPWAINRKVNKNIRRKLKLITSDCFWVDKKKKEADHRKNNYIDIEQFPHIWLLVFCIIICRL